MKKSYSYVIPIALFFVIISGLISGCEWLSPALTPPDSPYPADIIGQVVLTEYIQNWFMDEPSTLKPKEGNVFWVVNISVKNKTYPQPAIKTIAGHEQVEKVMWGYWNWAIEADDKIFNPPEAFKVLTTPILTIAEGQTAKLVNCFEVPIDLKIENAQIVYQGQEPYSFGKLTGGNTVAGYDWELKKVTQAQASPTKKEPRIPYGTYIYNARVYTSTITLNSDGTYMTDGFTSLSKDVGEYNITSDYITFISEANKKSDRYKYRYSDQFHCLYIYLTPNDDNPLPFYKH